MNINIYQKIYDYLKSKDMEFCWTENGDFITREKCIREGAK